MVLACLLALLIVFAARAERQPVTPAAAAEYKAPTVPDVVWSPDGKRFVWRQDDTLRLYDAGAKSEKELISWKTVEGRATEPTQPEAFHWTNRGVKEQPVQWLPTSDRLLLAAKGDLFLLTVATRDLKQLTKTAATEADPKLSPNGNRVAYRVDRDLWVMDLAGGKRERLTSGGTDLVRNGELDWVYPEELGLPTAYWWSPDSKRVAYLQVDLTGVMTYPHADLTGLRPVAEAQRFPQAGTPNPKVRLGVVASGGGRTRWLAEAGPDDLLARVHWMADSTAVAVTRLNRVQNRLQMQTIEAGTGRTRELLTESDPWWVNVKDDYRFLDGAQMLWGSERSGFRHLHLGTPSDLKALTSGPWEVTDVACVDQAKRRVFFVSTEPDPLERQLWTVGFDGSGKKRLSAEKGTHTVSFAPDCSRYVGTHSSVNEPPKVGVYSATGDQETVIRERDSTVFDKFRILPSEFVTVTAKDGAEFRARLLKPAGLEAGKQYPAVVMVYGGPHAQRVVDRWSGLDWEQALAQKGFVVWLLDNRGSAFRGHAWEGKLYRRFGKQELEDQLEGIEYLKSLGFVDPKRIGIYGWSYGGFLTLYSLLNAPTQFKAGIAGAPVTDWRQYDTIYTERYLGLPAENETNYRASSPVHQAGKLESSLLLVHNFEDDNVLFQHTLRMMDALQKANKPFDLMLYPQKAHAVTGGVRKHMLEGMTAFFERELKP
jgi:dipeptidyl-peptidase-4